MHFRVAQALHAAGIPYRLHRHADFPGPIKSPADFALALGYACERVTKTLLFQGLPSGDYGILVFASTHRAALRKVAEHRGCRRVQLATPGALQDLLGFPAGGVSPLGAGSLPVIIDQGLLDFASILIGAGEVGLEIEIAPADLIQITGAILLDIKED